MVNPFINCVFVGVIWKGDKLIEGVPETLDMLRAKVGKQKSQLIKKLTSLKLFSGLSFQLINVLAFGFLSPTILRSFFQYIKLFFLV